MCVCVWKESGDLPFRAAVLFSFYECKNWKIWNFRWLLNPSFHKPAENINRPFFLNQLHQRSVTPSFQGHFAQPRLVCSALICAPVVNFCAYLKTITLKLAIRWSRFLPKKCDLKFCTAVLLLVAFHSTFASDKLGENMAKSSLCYGNLDALNIASKHQRNLWRNLHRRNTVNFETLTPASFQAMVGAFSRLFVLRSWIKNTYQSIASGESHERGVVSADSTRELTTVFVGTSDRRIADVAKSSSSCFKHQTRGQQLVIVFQLHV